MEHFIKDNYRDHAIICHILNLCTETLQGNDKQNMMRMLYMYLIGRCKGRSSVELSEQQPEETGFLKKMLNAVRG